MHSRIHHDFVVFDRAMALIHDYDPSGELVGGWRTSDPVHVDALVNMFRELRARSIPYKRFLADAGVVAGSAVLVGPP